MKQWLLLSGLMMAGLNGCVVAPPSVAVAPPGVMVPSGVRYMAPTYPMPAPGYNWRYHDAYGWGWHHPQHGWHGGWR